jgi:hypothetical protein
MGHRTLGFVLLLLVLPASVAAQVRAGGEFQVNTYTMLNQYHPAMAMDAAGNFVIAWASGGQDGDFYGIFGQRYDMTGAPVGGEFRINSHTTSFQTDPAVAMEPQGRFVVIWESKYQDGSSLGIFGQRYDAAGVPQGAEFQVNTYTTGYQFHPAVAIDPRGAFVVVWASFFNQDGSDYGVFGQRYDSAATPLGPEFQVNTNTTGQQYGPDAAVAPDGSFVVVWASVNQDGSSLGIFAQRYDAAGAQQGGEFQVNTYTTGPQARPAVAMDGQGRFVVVWRGYLSGHNFDIFGQRYDAAGVRVGLEFQANTFTTGEQVNPRVAVSAEGDFVVVWQGEAEDGDLAGVFGQRYDAAGAPLGGEFQVNTYTTSYQRDPAVAMDPFGNFLVTWASFGNQDGFAYGVFAQRYGWLVPAALTVDPAGNGVLEPGEAAIVAPAWRNLSGAPRTFTGTASDLTGPPGATYSLADAAADYGNLATGVTGNCGSNCYQVSVSQPATRPALHWDITVKERLGPPSLGQSKVWTLHVGASFPDVPPSHPFYRFVETLLHVGVTAGCTAATYCPDGSTTREQMAVFLLRAREGGSYAPPPCTTAPFPDVPCSSPFAAWVQELVARGITAGCGAGLYCPTSPVTREQMAVFLLKTKEGIAFTPPPCTSAAFADVPCSSPFAPWVQELVARAITAGCGGGIYCPTDPVTRGQMAVFLTKTFGLTLYSP